MQEVRNAVDQANREAATRFDFKGTDSAIELSDTELVLTCGPTDDRLRALYQVLQEKLVKREVSLKSFDVGKIEEASPWIGPPEVGASRPASRPTTPRRSTSSSRSYGPEGRQLADPGRSAAHQRQETGRPADRPSLPSSPKTSAFRCSSTTSGTDARTGVTRGDRGSGASPTAGPPHRGPEHAHHQEGEDDGGRRPVGVGRHRAMPSDRGR